MRLRHGWYWLLGVLPAWAGTPVPWHVPSADVRFELEITHQPSEACAGIVVAIPDGGLVPRGHARAVVVDEVGQELPSASLGHEPRRHHRLVFTAPAGGRRAWVYFQPGMPRAVGTEFCPSLLMYTRAGAASLDVARQLNGGDDGGQVANIARRDNPFGPEDRYSSAHVGFLNITHPGRYYLATISDDTSEVRVNGRTVASWPAQRARREGQRGEFGDWVELEAGRHRIEYFHFQNGGDQEIHLVWRTPDMGEQALPVTVPASAFVQSGRAHVVRAEGRDGAPLAWFEFGAESYVWYGSRPLNLFSLRAAVTGQWELAGLRVTADRLHWVFEGDGPHEVTFQVGRSRCTLPVGFGNPPARVSFDNSRQRRIYGEALRARCQAVSAPRRPRADWTDSFWESLLALVAPGEARGLFDEVMGRSRTEVLALKPSDRWTLEDHYWHLLCAAAAGGDRAAARTALEWAERFLREERENPRRFHWQLARVEFTMYELDDVETARQMIRDLRDLANAAGAEARLTWQVRQGDIERLAGQLDRARQLYSAAQDEAARGRRDWRAAAVRQASYHEEVRSALAQGAWSEARHRLAQWERELPMSKMEGDFILAEARYWMAMELPHRALRQLFAFRQQTELSPFLPAAMQLERDCLIALKRYEELGPLVTDMQKRFPTLPLTQQTKDLARQYGVSP
ncbi:MAG: hypothetical protein NZ483_04775 [Verrucomicrobiae bacterium]|nr:hypothetical protein [Verrucomicrobiae bacterium]